MALKICSKMLKYGWAEESTILAAGKTDTDHKKI